MTLDDKIKEWCESCGFELDNLLVKDLTTVKGYPHQWQFSFNGEDYYLMHPKVKQFILEQQKKVDFTS